MQASDLNSELPSPSDAILDPAVRGQRSSIGAVLVLLAMLSFMGAMAGGLWFWTIRGKDLHFRFSKTQPMPLLGVAPAFALTERGGAEITSEMLKGRIWLADFIFTRCAGTCPAMSNTMSVLQTSLERIPELLPPAALVSFTVDPDWDTTGVLKDYATKYNANENQWLFLTGPYEKIQAIAIQGFKLGVQPGSDSKEEPIIHSQSLVLIDEDGRIRGYYDGTEVETPRRILADITRLLRERRRG